MKRRYNMTRSDNFPVCATMETICSDASGRIFVYTGFPVKSAIVAKVSGPDKAEVFPDMSFKEEEGFYVIYTNVEAGAVIKFTYQAQ